MKILIFCNCSVSISKLSSLSDFIFLLPFLAKLGLNVISCEGGGEGGREPSFECFLGPAGLCSKEFSVSG